MYHKALNAALLMEYGIHERSWTIYADHSLLNNARLSANPDLLQDHIGAGCYDNLPTL